MNAETRWVEPKALARTLDVQPAVVWEWCRVGAVLAMRLPGARGLWRVAVLADGRPVLCAIAPRAARRARREEEARAVERRRRRLPTSEARR